MVEILRSSLISLVPRLFFACGGEKIVWATAYSIFVPSTTFVALQSDCFNANDVTYCAQRWVGS